MAQFGFSVASAGDVNGDGYDDVIVGAPFEDNPSSDEGRVYIYHGSSSGLSNTAARILERDKAGAMLGYSVASAGNIDNDAYDDIIVGAPEWHDAGNQQREGKVWVWRGHSGGINADPDWNAEINTQDAYLGIAVSSAGDVDNDGDDEVLIGAYGIDVVYMWKGASSGFFATNGNASNYSWKATSDQSGSYFGKALAPAGYINNDAYADIIIGAPLYGNTSPKIDDGSAFVWFGGSSAFSGAVSSTSANWKAESDINTSGLAYPPMFGVAVAGAGDVNNDGIGDIVIGSSKYPGSGSTQTGSVFLWQGSSSWSTNGTAANATQRLNGEESLALFGNSVAGAGDVDNDGYDDVVVGAPLQNGTYTDGGRAYLFRGETNPCNVLCQITWCKFQDYLCTASIRCPGDCCDYTDCVATACTADPTCPPHACAGTCN